MKKIAPIAPTVLIVIGMFAGCDDGGGASTSSTSSPSPRTGSARPAVSSSSAWYQGGTLHRASALEWQNASQANKLATCADFVAGMWQNGNLKSSISNRLTKIDDVRPYAQELVDFLDAAFERDPDPAQNRRMYTNQTVASFAAMGMVSMGWTN